MYHDSNMHSVCPLQLTIWMNIQHFQLLIFLIWANTFPHCSAISKVTELLQEDNNDCDDSTSCQPMHPEIDEGHHKQPLFAFRQCMTPTFGEPQIHNDSEFTHFTFQTGGVRLCSNQWDMFVNGIRCSTSELVSRDSTNISCQISHNLANQVDKLSLTSRITHPNIGEALFIGGVSSSEVTRLSNPHIFPIRDKRLQQGSLYGGGLLQIFGSAFDPKSPEKYRVRLGDRYECTIHTIRHNQLTCLLQKIDGQKHDFLLSVPLYYSVEVKSIHSNAWFSIPCVGGSLKCVYNLSNSATPFLTSVQPAVVTTGMLLQLTGENLLQNDEDIHRIEIWVGPVPCLAQSYNNAMKQLTCQLAARVPYGRNRISYRASPRGYSFVPNDVHVTTKIQLDSVTPSSMDPTNSTAVIRLTGNGLDVDGMTIRIGPFGCLPTNEMNANPTAISCLLVTSSSPQLRPHGPVDLILFAIEPDPLLIMKNGFTFISDATEKSGEQIVDCPLGPELSQCISTTEENSTTGKPSVFKLDPPRSLHMVGKMEPFIVTSIYPQIGKLGSLRNSPE